MKNLKEVSNRIKEAVDNNEKIIIFADADLDGITSAVILEESVRYIGGDSVVYISRRDEWGHGMSESAADFMKEESPGLLVTLDCGVTNFRGVEKAKENGFEVIIIDHHQTLSDVPEASLILDPMQEGDDYYFKKLANVGIVYKLSQEVLGSDFLHKKRTFLELTTLGTIADMVPREKDNKEILDEGVDLLKNPEVVGLNELKKSLKDEEFIEEAVSLLNVTISRGPVNTGYLLLTEKNRKNAKKLIEDIKEEHIQRKRLIEREEQKILNKISSEDPIIFVEGDFPSSLVGTIATKVIKKQKKPVFVYVIEDGCARGSARVPKGYDAVDMMKRCQNYLTNFGGHAPAAGFRLNSEYLESFKSCLIKNL